MKLSTREENTLLYLETCMVDENHFAEGRRMNAEDHTTIDKLKAEGVLDFGRLPAKVVQKLSCEGIAYTHWVRFTDRAWALAHEARRDRAKRMLKNNQHSIAIRAWRAYDEDQCVASLGTAA